MPDPAAQIYVAGHTGLVGAAVVRRLEALGQRRIVTATHAALDLCDAAATERFFARERPDIVVLAAAKVGGIHANQTFPADFIRVNLQIQTNVLAAAQRFGVQKLLFLGSSCIYPKFAPQPLREDALLTGPLEPTNEAYAIAKIAGILMCRAYNRQYGTRYFAAMPTNLYGPGDHFDLQTSHVLPALIRRFDEARRDGVPEVQLWGTGTPRREFLFVDDLAAALVLLLDRFEPNESDIFVNVGTGHDLTIAELAQLVADVVGYRGRVSFDPRMPDGTPQKRLDVSRIEALGWRAETPLEAGIRQTYAWYQQHRSTP